jgi:spermidine/putrescine transport system permease protein
MRVRALLDYGRRPWMLAVFAVVFLFLYFPIAALIALSFNASDRTVLWEGFTLAHYAKAYANEQLHEAFLNTLIVAFVSTGIATALGTGLGVALHQFRFPGRAAYEGWLYLPIAIPEICMGVALLAFFAALDFDLSLATIIVSHVAFSIPFVALVVRARYQRFDPALAEASRDLGADEAETFRRVILPFLAPGIVAGALLAFTLSIDDFVISFFVSGPGSTTLPIKIYSMVRIGVTPEVNAASTVLIVLTAAVVLAMVRLQGRGRRVLP